MQKVLIASFLATLIVVAACANSPSSTQAADSSATPDGTTYVLTVEGMSCAVNCAPSVKASLESIDGVKRVDVSFEEKRAVVVMQPGHALTSQIADKAFGNDGYFVSEISEAASPADVETPAAPVAQPQG